MNRWSSSPRLTVSYSLLIVRSKFKDMSSYETVVYLPRWLLKPLTTSSVCQPTDLSSSHPAPTSFPKLEPSTHPPASPPGKPAERFLDFFSAGRPLNDLSCSLTSPSPEEGNMEMPFILRPSRSNLFQPTLSNSAGFSILQVRTYLSNPAGLWPWRTGWKMEEDIISVSVRVQRCWKGLSSGLNSTWAILSTIKWPAMLSRIPWNRAEHH